MAIVAAVFDAISVAAAVAVLSRPALSVVGWRARASFVLVAPEAQGGL